MAYCETEEKERVDEEDGGYLQPADSTQSSQERDLDWDRHAEQGEHEPWKSTAIVSCRSERDAEYEG